VKGRDAWIPTISKNTPTDLSRATASKYKVKTKRKGKRERERGRETCKYVLPVRGRPTMKIGRFMFLTKYSKMKKKKKQKKKTEEVVTTERISG